MATVNLTLSTAYTALGDRIAYSANWTCGFWYEKNANGTITIKFGVVRPNGDWSGEAWAGSATAVIGGVNMTRWRYSNNPPPEDGWGSKGGYQFYTGVNNKTAFATLVYTPTFNGTKTIPAQLSYSISDSNSVFIGDYSGTITIPEIDFTGSSGLPTFTVSAVNVDTNYDGTLKTAQLVIDSTSTNDDYTHFRVWSGTSTTYSGLNNTPTTSSIIDLTPGIYGDAFQTNTIPVYYQIIGDGYATGTQTGSTNVIIHPIGSVVQIYDTATQSWHPGELHVYHNNDWQIGKMYVNSLGNWKDVAE